MGAYRSTSAISPLARELPHRPFTRIVRCVISKLIVQSAHAPASFIAMLRMVLINGKSPARSMRKGATPRTGPGSPNIYLSIEHKLSSGTFCRGMPPSSASTRLRRWIKIGDY